MKNKVYRQKIKAKLNEETKRANKDKKRGEDLSFTERTSSNEDYYSYYKSISNGTLDRIIPRVPKDKSYGEIMFGITDSGRLDYYVLKIEEKEELGFVPTTLNHKGKELDLYSLLDTNKDDPYEKIFDVLKKYFKGKGSSITANFLRDIYFETREYMVGKGIDENTVYSLENNKKMLIPDNP